MTDDGVTAGFPWHFQPSGRLSDYHQKSSGKDARAATQVLARQFKTLLDYPTDIRARRIGAAAEHAKDSRKASLWESVPPHSAPSSD